MVFDQYTQPPYDGGTVTYIETYRNHDIYFLGHYGLQQYAVVDPDGVELNVFHPTITGIKDFIDSIAPEYPPILQIENLTYPPTANPGDTVNINWGIKNYGDNGGYPQWTRLIDTDTNQEIYGEQLALGTGASKAISTSWTMPTTVWNLRIETGYGTTLTASKSIKLNGIVSPILPLAAIALLAYLTLRK